MTQIKALFFDLDDTLHDFNRASGTALEEVYEKIAGRYKLDKTQLKDRYSELRKEAEEHAFLDGRLSSEYRMERFRNLLRIYNIEDEKFVAELVHLYTKQLEKQIRPFPGIEALLSKLCQKYELYIVTEGPVDAQQRAIEILGIKNYFKRIFISGEARKRKATGELFAHAIKETMHSPQEILLVGDSYKRDVLGGLKTGLKVIWVNFRNEKTQDGSPRHYYEIKDIRELGPILL
ncbi:MAG: HAD family hydrolase [Candidatus Micrarchaeota archaeon]